ncbi:MAG: discoidin domain-containing protein [Candidatus Eremiobacteraeota bacterium]|nr:discoidin domain-containing protein [Candidatus Eremiobacteraeota bacterium]
MRRFPMLLALLCALADTTVTTRAADIVVVDAAHPLRTVQPQLALGHTVDKEPAGSIPSLYSRHNVAQVLEAGWGWLSYRLFTELTVEDWHWNPRGHFSANGGGYWTSDASIARAPIADSFGYRLPHSGFTSDQGASEGYSRMTDGDARTYWKSNPYLSEGFTGDPQGAHPQWVVIDAGSRQKIDAIRVRFAHPFATSYRIEYWTGSDPIGDPGKGTWEPFSRGAVEATTLGQASALRAISAPSATRFVRILLLRSSDTCDSHGATDRRNCVGFAISEVYLGRFDRQGRLRDVLVHRACGGEKPVVQACGVRQSATYVSSVDPWHAQRMRVLNQEQPGLDLIARSGLGRKIGAFYPVAMLYSTPDNAVAEVRYLRARGYPIAGIELGEEPDGQYATPEDYGALYVRWARAIHRIEPSLRLGGPVFSGVNDDLQTWPDATGDISWLHRFIRYLYAHEAMKDLGFMSFEHYPFDGCEHGSKLTRDLLQEPAIMARVIAAWRGDGLPASVPMYVTEANFSAVNFTQVPLQIEGALWQADYMAGALSDGVEAAVYYQDEAVPLSQNSACPADWGNLTMFVADAHGTIRARGAQFWSARMLTHEWFAAGNALATLYRATTNAILLNMPAITAYPLKRADGSWSVMLINKDPHERRATVQFSESGNIKAFAGYVDRVTFGPAQYQWHNHGANSMPTPSGPPARSKLRTGRATVYVLPGTSITVLRGAIYP